jgi:uncharacterized protein
MAHTRRANSLRSRLVAGVEFEWDEHNVEHLARHGVSPEEAEEVYLDGGRDRRNGRQGEPRWWRRGRTSGGRWLTIVYTKRAGATRIISVFRSTPSSRKAERRARRRKGGR